MSDADWIEIERAVASAVGNFPARRPVFQRAGFPHDDRDGYSARMGFMHAMQAGHTSLENALLRILDLSEEAGRAARHWHADLIGARRPGLRNRPAILPPELASRGRRDAPVPQSRDPRLRQLRSRTGSRRRSSGG